MSTMRSTRSSGGRSGVAGRRAMGAAPRGPVCGAATIVDRARARDVPRRAGPVRGARGAALAWRAWQTSRPTSRTRPVPAYPAAWEADVVLHDGSTTHVRPIRPAATPTRSRRSTSASPSGRPTCASSPRSSGCPSATSTRLVTVDHVDRVALVAVSSGTDPDAVEQIIGVARYDRIGDDEAEVAFNIADAHQGRGLGSVLLEHLAAAARERGVRRFVAEVLPQNGRMIAVFREAGYEVRQVTEDGIVAVGFDIDPTDRSLAVMADREHRAEARSMRDLLHARSVRRRRARGGPRRAVRRAAAPRRAGGPAARATRRSAVHAVGVAGRPRRARYARAVGRAPGPVELAVVAVPAGEAVDVVRALSRLGVRGGRAALAPGSPSTVPTGWTGSARCCGRRTAAGMRVVGPARTGSSRRGDGGCAQRLAGARAARAAAGSGCSASPRRSRVAAAGGGAAPRARARRSSSPPGTGPTCPATTSCSSGPTTTAPTWSGCTWSRSATRASSPGSRGGCR